MPKVTELPAAAALDGTEKLALVQGSTTEAATVTQVVSRAAAVIDAPGAVAAEAALRLSADNAEAAARVSGDNTEITARQNAIAAEQTARATAIADEVTRADQTYAVVVNHGSDGSTARPATATQVMWIGTTTPVNAAENDLWQDKSAAPATLRRRNASTFEALTGNSVASTYQGILKTYNVTPDAHVMAGVYDYNPITNILSTTTSTENVAEIIGKYVVIPGAGQGAGVSGNMDTDLVTTITARAFNGITSRYEFTCAAVAGAVPVSGVTCTVGFDDTADFNSMTAALAATTNTEEVEINLDGRGILIRGALTLYKGMKLKNGTVYAVSPGAGWYNPLNSGSTAPWEAENVTVVYMHKTANSAAAAAAGFNLNGGSARGCTIQNPMCTTAFAGAVVLDRCRVDWLDAGQTGTLWPKVTFGSMVTTAHAVWTDCTSDGTTDRRAQFATSVTGSTTFPKNVIWERNVWRGARVESGTTRRNVAQFGTLSGAPFNIVRIADNDFRDWGVAGAGGTQYAFEFFGGGTTGTSRLEFIGNKVGNGSGATGGNQRCLWINGWLRSYEIAGNDLSVNDGGDSMSIALWADRTGGGSYLVPGPILNGEVHGNTLAGGYEGLVGLGEVRHLHIHSNRFNSYMNIYPRAYNVDINSGGRMDFWNIHDNIIEMGDGAVAIIMDDEGSWTAENGWKYVENMTVGDNHIRHLGGNGTGLRFGASVDVHYSLPTVGGPGAVTNILGAGKARAGAASGVDLTTNQSVGGFKTWTGNALFVAKTLLKRNGKWARYAEAYGPGAVPDLNYATNGNQNADGPIQQAINDALADAYNGSDAAGARVSLPAAQMQLGAGLKVGGSGAGGGNTAWKAVIEGVGRNQSVLKMGNSINQDVLTIDSGTGFYTAVRNLEIDGNKANNTSGHGIVGMNNETWLAHLRVHDCAWDGIVMGGYKTQAFDIHSIANGGWGFRSDADDTDLLYGWWNGNGTKQDGNGGNVKFSLFQHKVAFCQLENNGGRGFYFHDGGYTGLYGVTSIGSRLEDFCFENVNVVQLMGLMSLNGYNANGFGVRCPVRIFNCNDLNIIGLNVQLSERANLAGLSVYDSERVGIVGYNFQASGAAASVAPIDTDCPGEILTAASHQVQSQGSMDVSFPSGQTSATFDHGLWVTPDHVQIQPKADPGTVRLWVDPTTITDKAVTVNASAAPGAAIPLRLFASKAQRTPAVRRTDILPVAGASTWWKSGDITPVTDNTTPGGAWYDHIAVEPLMPVGAKYRTGTLTNSAAAARPSMQYDGVDDHSYNDTFANIPLYANTAPFTMIWCGAVIASVGPTTLWADGAIDNAFNRRLVIVASGGTYTLHLQRGATNIVSSSSATPGLGSTKICLAASCDPATGAATLYANGVAIGTHATNGAGGWNDGGGTVAGANNKSGANAANMHLADLAFYRKVLTAAEHLAVSNYLRGL